MSRRVVWRRRISCICLIWSIVSNCAGLAIIYISHFLDEVKEISDRFTVLRDGKSVGEGSSKSTATAKIISMMVGRDVEDLYPCGDRKRGEPVFEIENLAGKSKPRDASLTLHRGEILGIAGLIGAGRTEMLRCIFGLDSVRKGEVKIANVYGSNAKSASPARRWNQRVGMVSEDRKTEGLAGVEYCG